MIKKAISRVLDWLDYRLRRMCGEITPEKRLIVILSMCLIFGAMSIYITVSSIYHIGKSDAKKEFMEIEHIKRLELQNKDSINSYKIPNYGTESKE